MESNFGALNDYKDKFQNDEIINNNEIDNDDKNSKVKKEKEDNLKYRIFLGIKVPAKVENPDKVINLLGGIEKIKKKVK